MQALLPEAVFLDVTDENAPYWKIAWSCEREWNAAQWAGLRPDLFYAVYVDAQTGALLRHCAYGQYDGQTGVDAWDRWY